LVFYWLWSGLCSKAPLGLRAFFYFLFFFLVAAWAAKPVIHHFLWHQYNSVCRAGWSVGHSLQTFFGIFFEADLSLGKQDGLPKKTKLRVELEAHSLKHCHSGPTGIASSLPP
jgi:hypothetical protein